MTVSRFPNLFRLWLLASLKTSPDRLHFVPLFSKLFFFLASANWCFLFPCFVDLNCLVFKPRGSPRAVMLYELSYWASELLGSMATWPV